MCIGYNNLNNYVNMDSQSQHLIDHNYALNHIIDHDYTTQVTTLILKNDDNDAATDIADNDAAADEVHDPEPTIYRTLPGIQRNTKIYVDNLGYKYYKKKFLVDTITLICERQRNPSRPLCYGTASISKDEMDNRISIRTPHNHEPSPIDLNVPFLRNALTEKGLDPKITTTMSVQNIYEDEIISHQEAAKNYTFTQTKERVRRMKRLERLKYYYY
ncbi:uncharacterized protein LOC112602003 [Melanaphis sacchari]|uniref:uncharacterized protein LOC112602003 n=1 Tax=Melanaphis sacchari TaxID=742174 RepID=UPI000DC14A8E|nr:uncharacterized protein LOC112602003 [Melanaphis sacchari]XP_025205700.1 uncharacterized protein LOC112602003 [Melanaphis sacchari]